MASEGGFRNGPVRITATPSAKASLLISSYRWMPHESVGNGGKRAAVCELHAAGVDTFKDLLQRLADL